MPEEDEEIAEVCRGAPAWITHDAVKDTLRVFGPLYGDKLTVAEAFENVVNVGNLFDALKDRLQQEKGPPKDERRGIA